MFHYFDSAATTRVRPESVQAAAEAMTQGWGNPSSVYSFGGQAAQRVREWRKEAADALGCGPEELFFTSGGTESDNWAIQCGAALNRRAGRHILTTAIEHAAVLEPCRALERQGYEVPYLQHGRQGDITLEQVENALRPDTALVSMMLVNNELGTLLPVAQTGRLLRERGSAALFHCDAVQGFLKLPFTPKELGVDLLSVSGHKVHAPKGVGALYIRRGVKLPPLLLGGGQEAGLRSGTEATGQIAAFAAAVRLGRAEREETVARIAGLREYAVQRLTEEVEGLRVLVLQGAPHILPVTLPGYKSEVVVRFLSDRGIFLSSGSACHKGRPSHVFAALGLPKGERDGALRISFSGDTSREDVDALVQGLREARAQLFPSLS